MQVVEISDELITAVPTLQLSCIECDVEVLERNDHLWEVIIAKIGELNRSLKVEDISKLPRITSYNVCYTKLLRSVEYCLPVQSSVLSSLLFRTTKTEFRIQFPEPEPPQSN